MFSVKLSPFKRLLMLALMFCVNTFYGARMSYAESSLYSTYSYSEYIAYNYGGMGDSIACLNCCYDKGGGYAILGSLFFTSSAFGTMVYMSGVELDPSACYCIASSVYQAMESCIGMTCGSFSHGYGSGHGYYDLFSKISGEYNNCVPETDKCGCIAGYRAWDMISCIKCAAGYSCSPTTSMWINDGTRCSVGHYSDAGWAYCTSCPQGTYASGTGSSSCTPCSRGYYNSSYGQSSCTRCPVYEADAVFYNAIAQNTAIISSWAFYASTESSGAQGPSYCYLPVISVGTIYSTVLKFQGFRGENGQMIQEGSCKYQYN